MRAALVLALAAALAAVPASQASASMTLELVSYVTVTRTHDNPPRGKPNRGDRIDFKDLLVTTAKQLGKAKGKPVGYDAGSVRYMSATKQEILVKVTFPGIGTLTYQGVMNEAKDGSVTVPIRSGTGQFKGVHGTVKIGSGEQKAPNTFRFTVPRKIVPPGSPVA